MTPDPLFDVSDQVVLVSGGSRGIGYAMATAFAERGAKVVVTGRSQGSLEKLDLEGIACDVTDPDSITRLVAGTLSRHGRIDTLINVAGVNRRKPALEVTEDDYDAIMEANLKGAFLLSKAVGAHMLDRGAGNQINIGSLTTNLPGPQLAPYAMSKAGMGRMTQVLAMEWGPGGVRVNCIAPGFIITDLTRKLWAHEKMLAWGVPGHPLRRIGKPEDLLSTAIYLASPGAAWMTGQIVTVDGGFTCGWNWPIGEL